MKTKFLIPLLLFVVMVGFLAVGVNLLLNWIFTFRLGWGHRGLAFSTGCIATLNFLVLYVLMRRQLGALHTRHMAATLGKVLLATLLLALVCWFGSHWLLADWAHMRFLPKLGGLLATIVVAGAGFVGAALLLRIGDVDDIAAAIRRRVARRRHSAT